MIVLNCDMYRIENNIEIITRNAVVTCEIKLFQNYFNLCRRPSEIILPEIISKLFQRLIAANKYFSTCSMLLK